MANYEEDILEGIDDSPEEVDAIEVYELDDEDVIEDGEIVPSEMTKEEALEITESIRSTVIAVYVLLDRAHQGKAYKALGYETWKDYIAGEFDFSTQRSYQLLDLAKATKAIEEASPEGYTSNLTEAQARDIKRELPKITKRIEDETEGLDPDDVPEKIKSIIEETREDTKKEKDPKPQVSSSDEEDDDEEREARNKELEEEADRILDSESGLSGTHDYENVDADEDERVTRTKATYFYSFKTIIEAGKNLPDPKEMVDIIADNQRQMVEEDLEDLYLWITDFKEEWDKEH